MLEYLVTHPSVPYKLFKNAYYTFILNASKKEKAVKLTVITVND